MRSRRRFLARLHPEGIPWPGSLLYDAVSRSTVFHAHYQLVAEDVARLGAADRILDVGTGPGRLLLALRRQFPHAALVGIDVSAAMIERARRNVFGRDDGIQVQVARADGLPFADGTFDRVVSTGSLHHWKTPQAGLAEAHRILKDGGYALVYDLVRRMPGPVKREVRAKFGGFRLALLWLHSFEEPFWSPAEMEALARQSRFVLKETRFVGALCGLVLRKGS